MDFVDLIRPYVEHSPLAEGDPLRLLLRTRRRIGSWDALLAELPDDLRALSARLREGTTVVHVDLHDPDDRVDQLVDGLIVAALTVSASELLSRHARPAVGSLSVPGAAALGLGIAAYTRLRRRSRHFVPLSARAVRGAQAVLRGRRRSAERERGDI